MARATTTTVKRQKTAANRRTQTPPRSDRIPAQLRRLVAQPQKQELRWWFDVGHLALLLNPQPSHGEKRKYGTKIINDLAQQLSPEKPKNTTNMLWQARKLALRFDDWAALKKFQGNLSVWHVMSLLAVDENKGSKSTMQELHDRCVLERWSVDRLKHEIQNDKGGKMGCGRHPSPLTAATPAIAVKDLYFAARRWMAYHDQCLAGGRGVLKHARRRDFSPYLLRDVQGAIEELKQVQEAVRDELKELRHLEKNINAALKA